MAWQMTPDDHRDAAAKHFTTADGLQETGGDPERIQRETSIANAQLRAAEIKEK
jgi:hypothetical protein